MAVGRKLFLFVGSERAGHAAAIYYSLIESCKANKANPLTYLTYVLSSARSKAVVLPRRISSPTSAPAQHTQAAAQTHQGAISIDLGRQAWSVP